jgi:RNA polymerase sigma-70 factor (sigma-E family)
MGWTDDSFVEFVRMNSARLQHAAYLLLGDRHLAEDAAQTALMRTYAAWNRIRIENAYAYTRKILTNHVVDNWRRPIREHAVGDVPDHPTSRDLAHDVVQQDWVIEALGSLTPRERVILVLRHYFDLTEAEVARELKVSKGTVKSMNSRALSKLRITITPRDQISSGTPNRGERP